ncbi:VOC family protein [Nocardiopsis suaedae]|uniref:Glyoxalase/bleomycin resistance/dioxygenase family protein n=1 Tax=Nocardiopsis suaedae TaxID=3018444 RepID=A0ABT4TLN5_9ACTN|nr:glyoxalase/bleomycin resistance/dioxygenase family protein [Nocardiopsis suaedae]MDA2805002.1 glyoxalase/bleomycin resistance/dioxygenase family protein [Nocardiopsis suaedae]
MPDTTPLHGRLSLLVLYTERLEDCRAFYSALGLSFAEEKHGDGPEHHAAVLDDGTVVELYPVLSAPTGPARLGLEVDGGRAVPPLAPGRHVLIDPDGRKVDVQAVGAQAGDGGA